MNASSACNADRAAALGQSIWYDNISRDLLESGEVARLIAEEGVRGITSNPSIFQKAMSTSAAYAEQFAELAAAGLDTPAIYEALAIRDIQAGADLLRPVFDAAGGRDGFVSLEVSPSLAADTDGTVAEARRLHAAVDRPNVMIKVPATPEGIPAVRALIADGISVNVTLIFSLVSYSEVIDAYMGGLEERLERGEALDHVNSVASFFVSRVDGAVDALLDAQAADPDLTERANALKGKAAVANAKMAYELYDLEKDTDLWRKLAAAGANPQRPLWASTSTKNPAYPDTLYVDTLIGAETVNTLPPATLAAFNDHGTVADTVREGLAQAAADIEAIEELGISLEEVCDELLEKGVKSFADAFDGLLAAVDARRKEVPAASGAPFASAGSTES